MHYSIIRIKIYFPSIISNTDFEYSYISEYSGRNKTILNKELLIYDDTLDGQFIHSAASYFIANSQSNYVKLEIKTKKDYKNVEFVLIYEEEDIYLDDKYYDLISKTPAYFNLSSLMFHTFFLLLDNA